jgi:peroxin-5
MTLGVSYTNELEEGRARSYLRTWMANHPDYQAIAAASNANANAQAAAHPAGSVGARIDEVFGGAASRMSEHDEITRMFLDAVKVNPRDADLHTVLGVLFHISSDFDKAIEAFKTAVKLRPDDPALWNKLGATQANSQRSAAAVHAYER